MLCLVENAIGLVWGVAILLIVIGWLSGWRLTRTGPEFPQLRIVLYAVAVVGVLFWGVLALLRFPNCG